MIASGRSSSISGRRLSTRAAAFLLRSLPLLIVMGLILAPAGAVYGQGAVDDSAPTSVDAPLAGDPGECIDPLKAAHITATVISLLPIPGFSDGGDVAEYLANLALKLCEAVLDPSEDLIISNPAEQSLIDNDPCTYYVRLPLTDDDMDLIVLDREMIQEIIAEISLDPTLRLSAAFLSYLEEYLASEFGRFESQKQGEYSDIYGIVFSSSSHGTDWGDLGSPDVYHYNSDIRVELFHPGERVDEDYIRFLPGDHALRWEGNTLISVIDFVPPIPGPFDNPVSEKVAKQTGEKSLREALRRAAREAIEQGSTEFAKKVAKETVKAFSEELAKNIAKKTLQTAVEETLESYFSLGKPHGVVQRDVQRVVILDGNAPVISGAQDITVEALEPGGASSGVHMAAEQAKLTVTDDCDPEPTLRYATPAFWPLNVDDNGNPLPSSEIVWTAEDNGAATVDGGRNSSSAVSAVTVVDTKPPILGRAAPRRHGGHGRGRCAPGHGPGLRRGRSAAHHHQRCAGPVYARRLSHPVAGHRCLAATSRNVPTTPSRSSTSRPPARMCCPAPSARPAPTRSAPSPMSQPASPYAVRTATTRPIRSGSPSRISPRTASSLRRSTPTSLMTIAWPLATAHRSRPPKARSLRGRLHKVHRPCATT